MNSDALNGCANGHAPPKKRNSARKGNKYNPIQLRNLHVHVALLCLAGNHPCDVYSGLSAGSSCMKLPLTVLFLDSGGKSLDRLRTYESDDGIV